MTWIVKSGERADQYQDWWTAREAYSRRFTELAMSENPYGEYETTTGFVSVASFGDHLVENQDDVVLVGTNRIELSRM